MIKIQGGTLYDPANGIDGKTSDIWVAGGSIVDPASLSETDKRGARIIDASGLVVMPGGIDMHCHIAGPKVNSARMLRPEDQVADELSLATQLRRSGKMGSVPSTFTTGYRYAALGYTTAFDAAVSPAGGQMAHAQFADTPCTDNGFYALVANNHYVLDCIRTGDNERLSQFVGWLLSTVKAYAPKLVNPGGVESWKRGRAGTEIDLDEKIDYFDVTPRQIIAGIVRAGNDLALPHPAHIHCNNLGLPGNWRTTLETMRMLDGLRAHLTHIQFHSYGGGGEDENSLSSRVPELAAFVNENSNITVDVGQVVFGATTSLTGDGPLGQYLHDLGAAKWISDDLEIESSCGVSPITYRNKNLLNAIQWAIGLEWYLLVDDPWQIAMSTDHPNGGSFLAYPHIISLLMDRAKRREYLQSAPEQLAAKSCLADLEREYSLAEIAIITRAAPAKMLGLERKGHLGVGADADITIYLPDRDFESMFQLPKFVLQSGRIIVDDFDIKSVSPGRPIFLDTPVDPDRIRQFESWFHDEYTVDLDSYRVELPTFETN